MEKKKKRSLKEIIAEKEAKKKEDLAARKRDVSPICAIIQIACAQGVSQYTYYTIRIAI